MSDRSRFAELEIIPRLASIKAANNKSERFIESQKNIQSFLNKKSHIPCELCERISTAKSSIDLSQILEEIEKQVNSRNVSFQEKRKSAEKLSLESIDFLTIQEPEINSLLSELEKISRAQELPQSASTILKQSSQAAATRDLLFDISECIKLSEALRNEAGRSLLENARNFAKLSVCVKRLPIGGRTTAVFSERMEFFRSSLRLKLKNSFHQTLQSSGMWPPPLGGVSGEEISRFSKRVREHLLAANLVEEGFGFEILVEPLITKLTKQFASPDSELCRLDRPDWPMRRALEILHECFTMLNDDQADVPPLSIDPFAAVLATRVESFYREYRFKHIIQHPALIAGYVSVFVQAYHEWNKIGAGESIMCGFNNNSLVTNGSLSKGLLDLWIASDLSYCREQLVLDVYSSRDKMIADIAILLCELLHAGASRIAVLSKEAQHRIVDECYSIVVSDTIKRIRNAWNDMQGGCSDPAHAALLVNSMEYIASVTDSNRSQLPGISQEAARISLHMLSKVHNHIHDAFADALYHIFNQPGIFYSKLVKHLLQPYKTLLKTHVWLQLEGLLRAGFEDDLISWLKRSQVDEIEMKCMSSNIEVLGLQLPRVEAYLLSLQGYDLR